MPGPQSGFDAIRKFILRVTSPLGKKEIILNDDVKIEISREQVIIGIKFSFQLFVFWILKVFWIFTGCLDCCKVSEGDYGCLNLKLRILNRDFWSNFYFQLPRKWIADCHSLMRLHTINKREKLHGKSLQQCWISVKLVR